MPYIIMNLKSIIEVGKGGGGELHKCQFLLSARGAAFYFCFGISPPFVMMLRVYGLTDIYVLGSGNPPSIQILSVHSISTVYYVLHLARTHTAI